MASSFHHRNSLITIFLLSVLRIHGGVGCYTAIFSFGDSLGDTGNGIRSEVDSDYSHYPYGETFFHHPTGRCSDGRLIIDFMAQALGLPFVPPYLGGKNQDFAHGVNFAVAGATALDATFFDKEAISVETNYSMGIQLSLFNQLLPTLCLSPPDCRNILRNALFLVGEIGGNDYSNSLFQGKDVQETWNLVPKVIDIISSTITALIAEGAVTLMVPGNFPLGCSASYLTVFDSQDKNDYDSLTGCLNWMNELVEFHNSLLQLELNQLRAAHPHATIIYVDYYNVAMNIYRFPKQIGFNGGALTACCGGGGTYNYNPMIKCGEVGSNVCDDPSIFVSWDGMHFTEAAYKWIATRILKVLFTNSSASCMSSHLHHINHLYE